MKIFHHNDADGFCSARLVIENSTGFRGHIETIEMHYNKDFPHDIVMENEEVWIVDFSIPPEDMTKLLQKTSKVIWIDHHISAIKKYESEFNGNADDIKGVRRVGLSGCELTWLYLSDYSFDNTNEWLLEELNDKAPTYVSYIPYLILISGGLFWFLLIRLLLKRVSMVKLSISQI